MAGRLKALVRPESIAIVGASADFRKVSGRPLKHLLDKGYAGSLFPVNPRYREIAGLTCYPDIDSLPEPVDLAVIVLPARAVSDAIRALGRKSVPVAIVFASGFAEMGAAGRELESALLATARQAGVRVLGPNCIGMLNAFERVIATFSQYVDGEVPSGPAGFVSQSGAFGTAISALARARGLGFGYFVNTGNESDVTFVDAMQEIIEDDRIRVCAGYIEGVKDGPGLCELADRALEVGKPLLLTKVGRMSAGARAAASHTGSLAGEDAVFDGIARQKGIVRARNEERLLDLVEVFAFCDLPKGRGIGIATQSGGAGILIADRAEEIGLEVPYLCEETQAAIKAALPAFCATGNPVDVTGQFVAEPAMLRDSVIHMLSDPDVHVGIIWLQLMEGYVDDLIKIFENIKAKAEKPFVVAWVAAPQRAVEALHERGIAVLRGAEPAAEAVAGLVAFAEARRRREADAQAGAGADIPALRLPDGEGPVPTDLAAAMLLEHGVNLAPVALGRDAEAAVKAAEQLGYPVAMKIESPNIFHKTEVGGVRLGLACPDAVRTAHDEIVTAARAACPEARISGVIVQAMGGGDVEFVIGLKEDLVFGPVIMAGLGGVLIEAIEDVAFRRCPLTAAEAGLMLDDLRGAAILGEIRGRPAVDRDALIRMLCAVSHFGAGARGRIAELDLNPVLLSKDGAIAVDVVMMLAAPQGAQEAVEVSDCLAGRQAV